MPSVIIALLYREPSLIPVGTIHVWSSGFIDTNPMYIPKLSRRTVLRPTFIIPWDSRLESSKETVRVAKEIRNMFTKPDSTVERTPTVLDSGKANGKIVVRV